MSVAPSRNDLRHARIAVSVMFLLCGTTIGAWTARIPTIKHGLGLSDAQLSIALLALAAGGLTGMQVVGRLVDRYGSTRVMTATATALGPLLIPTAYATNVVRLTVALFLFGTVQGTLNVAMNANAVHCERAYGRRIMSSCHAVYSIGGFLGAAIGAVFAHANLSPRVTFMLVASATSLIALLAARWALPTAAQAGRSRRPAGVGRTRRGSTSPGRTSQRVLLLGGLVFCALIGEGAAADWASVYVHDSLRGSTATAAYAFAGFSLMMTAGRLSGDRLATRLGPVTLVRICAIVACTGLATGVLIGRPAAAIAGFGLLGAGLSCIVPQVYSVAGTLNPTRAGRDLARVAMMGYLGFLLGPVLIGLTATHLGLPTTMLILPVLFLLPAAAAHAVRAPQPVVKPPTRRTAPPQPPRPRTGIGRAQPAGRGKAHAQRCPVPVGRPPSRRKKGQRRRADTQGASRKGAGLRSVAATGLSTPTVGPASAAQPAPLLNLMRSPPRAAQPNRRTVILARLCPRPGGQPRRCSSPARTGSPRLISCARVRTLSS